MKKLVSDTVYLSSDTQDIESTLSECYGQIVRWAVVDVSDNKLKVSFTYESD